MQIVAIIAEFNPFHNGHAFLVSQIKQHLPNYAIFAIMSGSLVQRGELAILDKYNRAKTAVLCGINAVFELPAVYSCAPANLFSQSAVSILSRLGAEILCFGSESADLDLLNFAAEKSSNAEFLFKLNNNINSQKNKSYPVNFKDTFEELYGEKSRIFAGSNDILAIEYLRAAKKINLNLKFFAVKRNEEGSENYKLHASFIREQIFKNNLSELKNLMPEMSRLILGEALKYNKIADINNISSAIIYKIKSLKPAEISRFAEINGGIEYKIKNSCENVFDYQTLIKTLNAKHLTQSQIRRMILNIFFEITREEQLAEPQFTNLLCADKIGLKALNLIKKNAQINIVSKAANARNIAGFEKNIFIDNIYKLAYFNKSDEKNALLQKPIIL